MEIGSTNGVAVYPPSDTTAPKEPVKVDVPAPVDMPYTAPTPLAERLNSGVTRLPVIDVMA